MKVIKDIIFTKEIPYEYFCIKCLQLRLAFGDNEQCGNCGCTNIIKGAVNSLDKKELKLKYSKPL